MLTKILQSHWKLLVIFGVFGLAASFGLSLAKEPVYSAESRILIRYLQTQGIDAYVASRAASKIGQTLSEVATTELFLQKVLATPFMQGIQFPPANDPLARRRFWQDSINVSVGIDSHILRVRAYAKTPANARSIVQAVTYVLLTQGAEFHGAANLVSLTQVDAPAVIPSPMRSQLVVNSVYGLLVGLLIGFVVSLIALQLSSRRMMLAQKRVTPQQRDIPVPQITPPEETRQAASIEKSLREHEEVPPRRVIQEQVATSQGPSPIGESREEFIHTIFDDVMRLGLDLKKLSVEA